MKKIIISLSIIAAVAAVAIYATTAYFSDTETSTGNTFTAGAIDLTVDSTQSFNGNVCQKVVDVYQWVGSNPYPVPGTSCNGTWTLTDLGPTNQFFNFTDIKPGDSGENTISLHVDNNDAWGCVNIIPTMNDDVSSTEPELEAGDAPNTDSIYDGELAQNMTFKIWADVCDNDEEYEDARPGDNIFQENCDLLLTEGTGPITPTTYALADSENANVFTGLDDDPLVGTQDYFLGVEWGISTTTGNIIQTDKYQANISFYVEQSRNNPNFVCPSVPNNNHLRLENEIPVVGGPWTVINDGIFADLTWAGDGLTFNYNLTAQGLPINTPYSLIYYADGWPGNHPGALIGEHTTTGTGTLNVINAITDLGINLPMPADGNYAIGAKIWLIPSSAYDSATKSVISWPPVQNTWLFEGNVYIHYHDTSI